MLRTIFLKGRARGRESKICQTTSNLYTLCYCCCFIFPCNPSTWDCSAVVYTSVSSCKYDNLRCFKIIKEGKRIFAICISKSNKQKHECTHDVHIYIIIHVENIITTHFKEFEKHWKSVWTNERRKLLCFFCESNPLVFFFFCLSLAKRRFFLETGSWKYLAKSKQLKILILSKPSSLTPRGYFSIFSQVGRMYLKWDECENLEKGKKRG